MTASQNCFGKILASQVETKWNEMKRTEMKRDQTKHDAKKRDEKWRKETANHINPLVT